MFLCSEAFSPLQLVPVEQVLQMEQFDMFTVDLRCPGLLYGSCMLLEDCYGFY